MTVPLALRIIEELEQAKVAYHRLVLVVGATKTGKTTALRAITQEHRWPLVNVNLELSRRMLDLTSRQRTLQLPRLLAEIVGAFPTDVVLLDNVEILFDVSLKQDPLRLLQGLSRNKTVVTAWSGEIRTECRGLRTMSNTDDSSLCLVYATPDHPEYRRYPVQDFLVVNS